MDRVGRVSLAETSDGDRDEIADSPPQPHASWGSKRKGQTDVIPSRGI
jgi:hypothetical protein